MMNHTLRKPSPKTVLFQSSRHCQGVCPRPRSVQVNVSPDLATNTVEGESKEAAMQRRIRESDEVDARIKDVFTIEEFNKITNEAQDKLIIIQVEQDGVCETGQPEPELHWQKDKEAALEPCRQIKHVFQRTARESADCEFLMIQSDPDSEETNKLLDHLNVEVFPSLIFMKNGRKLWQHNGALHLDNTLGTGVMYYGDVAGGGEKPSQFVKELTSEQEIVDFIKTSTGQLQVVYVSTVQCLPCIKIFPAVMALAKNMEGLIDFSRIVADEIPDGEELLRAQKIVEVPCFIFYQNSREIKRHVGSSRGDLMGQVLLLAQNLGINLPAPRAPVSQRRKVKSK